jgi:hypothetical protein
MAIVEYYGDGFLIINTNSEEQKAIDAAMAALGAGARRSWRWHHTVSTGRTRHLPDA